MNAPEDRSGSGPTKHNESALPPKANVGMGQTRSGRSTRLPPKVLAISAHTILKLEQTAGAALNDALLRQIVDNLRRHPKAARQSVGRDRRKRRLPVGLAFFLILVIAPGDHSITSSARASSVGGTSMPSALAVLRLMTSSYLVGACTGRSAGFSPLRMRST